MEDAGAGVGTAQRPLPPPDREVEHLGLDQLRREVGGTADRLADLLRAVPDGRLRAGRVDWSVAEVAAHLVTVVRRYRRMATTPQPFPPSIVRDGTASVERRRPDRADLHLSVDPVSFLLTSYGAPPRWRALLPGGALAWGRRPWLAGPFSRLFTET